MIQVALLQFPRARLSNLVAETPSRGGELSFKAILDKEAVTYDRQLLLVGSRRNEVLDLSETRRYGIDSYGDADYVSIYGLSPTEWYRRGIRLLGRTVVECTRDRLAGAPGRDTTAPAHTGGRGAP